MDSRTASLIAPHRPVDATTNRPELPPLTFNEQVRVRHVMERLDAESIESAFGLRSVLGELGLFPDDDEVTGLLELVDQKLSFNALCRYLSLLKRRHQVRAPSGDQDALRWAFSALAGPKGYVSLDALEHLCAVFCVAFDSGALPPNAEGVDLETFKKLWSSSEPYQRGSDVAGKGVESSVLERHRVAPAPPHAQPDLSLERLLPELKPSARVPARPPPPPAGRRRSRPEVPLASKTSARALRSSVVAPPPLPLPPPQRHKAHTAQSADSAPVGGGYKAPSPTIVGLSARHRAYGKIHSGRRPAAF